MSPREEFAEAFRRGDALMAEEAVARMVGPTPVRWPFVVALVFTVVFALAGWL